MAYPVLSGAIRSVKGFLRLFAMETEREGDIAMDHVVMFSYLCAVVVLGSCIGMTDPPLMCRGIVSCVAFCFTLCPVELMISPCRIGQHILNDAHFNNIFLSKFTLMPISYKLFSYKIQTAISSVSTRDVYIHMHTHMQKAKPQTLREVCIN